MERVGQTADADGLVASPMVVWEVVALVGLGRDGLRCERLTREPHNNECETALRELLAEGTDASLLREIICFSPSA